MVSIQISSSPTLGLSLSSTEGDHPEHASPELSSKSSELTDTEGEDQDNYGDYSTRMEELFSDQTDGEGSSADGAAHSRSNSLHVSKASYRDQLRDVLGTEHSEDELDDEEELEVERSLMNPDDLTIDALQLDHLMVPETQIHVEATLSDPSSSPPSTTFSPNQTSSSLPGTPKMKFANPFLHPAISRLRSSPSQGSSPVSSATAARSISNGLSPPESSHFSALSRDNPSTADLQKGHESPEESQPGREVFHWTHLGGISNLVFAQRTPKASSILGSPDLGSPMVLAANGLICIGTHTGLIAVFDFKQTLKCICGKDVADKTVGAVTSLALSHDHTYVASGHSSGHIRVFDLNNPGTPARTVTPTSVAAVKEGRREGHFAGSPITSIGFIAGRHTAIATADDTGLAFYHSLGKVLFVDATDVIRILGKYPEDVPQEPVHPVSHKSRGGQNGLLSSGVPMPFRRRRERKANTILSMAPLPLGTCPHKTDPYNIIALLTPMKLVIVGLKPTPTTWYRHSRGQADVGYKHRWKGSMAWFPCVDSARSGGTSSVSEPSTNGKPISPTMPTLVYTWGDILHLVRVSERRIMHSVKNAKTGKISQVEVGTIVIEEVSTWTVGEAILAVQWLNLNQIVVVTPSSLQVHDVHLQKLIDRAPFDATSLVSPTLGHTTNGTMSYSDSVLDVAHSVRVYKNKIFLLGRQDLQVGTLLTWADRILSFVQDGDFLNAIELVRSYYVGEATGNRNGLPDDPKLLKDAVGEKMRELMTASARYAFSEDRMTDSTHISPDGRGVDRTTLFEDLVSTCTRACIALDDLEFLFEDLFQYYDGSGIARIYLTQLEPFILDSTIREVPPRITQRIVAMHAEDGRPDLAERVIWHIDPSCLDINQAISLCQTHYLYDALIYVYTRALKDYVSPIVKLIGLVRKVQQFRRDRNLRLEEHASDLAAAEEAIEPFVVNAYKIYPYMADILSGLTYPSEEPLSASEAIHAKNDVYNFLFFGRSSVWPAGEDGELVLTSDEEGGVEPTYPYLRLLLRFDAESLLNSLDLAFEDSYLNDETPGVNRLFIAKVLLEILSSSDLSPSDTMFVNIFLARNVPKYPQFIQIAPSDLHNILISLAEYPDRNTREDRQLAAEFLLSAYTPHDGDRILQLFEQAGFYRILRTWHRQDQRWGSLISAFLMDPELHPSDVFVSVDDVLQLTSRSNQGVLPPDLSARLAESIPDLLHTSIIDTAMLLDKHAPTLHTQVLETLGDGANDKRFDYLRCLFGLPPLYGDGSTGWHQIKPPNHIPQTLRHLYVSLQCKLDSSNVINALSRFPVEFFEWSEVLQACEENDIYDAIVWGLNWKGDSEGALQKADIFQKDLTARALESLGTSSHEDTAHILDSVSAVAHRAIDLCLEHSRDANSAVKAGLEDMWFELLRGQIECVQAVSEYCSSHGTKDAGFAHSRPSLALSTLRSLVQETFGSLVSVSSTRQISFPRLFKRLVDSATHSSRETHYTEFRTILTGMLESYRSDGDMFTITKHLLDRDVFDTVEEMARARVRGWMPRRVTCHSCGKRLLSSVQVGPGFVHSQGIVVSRAGTAYHDLCYRREE